MTLGILGGLGPAAGAHFYTRLIALTQAESDRDHVDVLLSGHASTPDRTAFLLGYGPDPGSALASDARRLQDAGADLLVLLCHTAHAFLPVIRAAVAIPVLDMIDLTLAYAAAHGYARLGLLSSDGTYAARLYSRAAAPYGLSVDIPSAAVRACLRDLIYGYLKRGKSDGGAAVRTAAASLGARGCPAVVLGCTELSLPVAHPHATLYYRTGDGRYLPQALIDPVEILCRRAIALCGKQVKKEIRDATVFFAEGAAFRHTADMSATHGDRPPDRRFTHGYAK